MRLETASVGVRDLRFSDRTRFEDGVLSIQKEELRQLLLEDDTFEDVALEVVRPGESVRIIHVMDAVEPRYKPEPWSTFPRFVGPLKAAAYLARAAAGVEPDSLEVHELLPVEIPLPRVVYFFQLSGLLIYGQNVDTILPSLIHPNEILDGAVVNNLSNLHASYRYSTFDMQNHAVVRELYARHGTDLDFAGVIVYPAASDDVDEKEMLAEYAVKLARMLGAQGACNSYLGGGHPAVEFMLICQKGEAMGIKTVQIMPESY